MHFTYDLQKTSAVRKHVATRHAGNESDLMWKIGRPLYGRTP